MYIKELATKKYLVIDDFSDMRSMMKSMLTLFGVTEVTTANDGNKAIAALESDSYDVVLCDYNLGAGKDGQQVLEEAKHRELIGIGAIWIMITAENTREMVMGAVEYQPDGYLSKPFNKDVLQARLEKLVAKKADLAMIQKAVQDKNYNQAIKLLDERIQQKPRNVGELTRYKAELCLQAQKYDMAGTIFEQVLAVRDVPWAALGLGQVHYARGNYDQAKEIFQELIEENKDFITAYDWLSKAHKAQGNLSDAQAVLQQAVELSPKAILRQKTLGDLALANNDTASAEAAFNKAINLGRHSVYRHPDTYAKLACTKSKQDANEDALEVIKKLKKEFANNKEAELLSCTSQSIIYTNMGDEERAQENIKEAEKLFDHLGVRADPGIALEMAKACAAVGDQERSLQIIKDTIRNNHDNDDLLLEIKTAHSSLNLGGDAEDLISGIRKEVVQLNNKGVALTREGKLTEAIELFDQAADAMPANRVININAAKGLILYMQKNGPTTDYLGKTKKYLDRIRKLEPNNPTLKQLQTAFVKVVESAGGG
jgi:tetratricopeptide (TPR) repeat protein